MNDFFLMCESKKHRSVLSELLQKLIRDECSSPGSFYDETRAFYDEIISIKKTIRFLLLEAVIPMTDVDKKRDMGRKTRENEVSEIAHQGVLPHDIGIIERAFVEYHK